MTKDESSFYKSEMDKIQRRINGIHDQYNSEQNPFTPEDYQKLISADINFTPKKGQTWEQYYHNCTLYAEMNAKKSIKTHINGPKGAWFTHRNPYGCFACEDINLIAVLVRTIGLMSSQYPTNQF